MLIPEIESAAVPVFVRVTTPEPEVPISNDPKDNVVGDTLATGITPVPDKLAACGLPGALSITVNVPVLEPVVLGVKTI